ncbi:hypothetical protein AX16_008402 [Volvariella volvacea WC 439]|nr:hypothetical protein AX16_008402 [Volvariella volvacea WC 439]
MYPQPDTNSTLTHPRRASSSVASDEDSLTQESTPSISRLYTEAALFERALSGSAPIKSPTTPRDEEHAFNSFVKCHMNDCEKALAGRTAKYQAAGYNLAPADTDLGPDVDHLGSDVAPLQGKPRNIIRRWRTVTEPVHEAPVRPTPAIHRAVTEGNDSWQLEPDEIVRLLVQEFDALVKNGEEEKLILETDGAFVSDVVIVGVIHLTTHRLAFHASLLATRPDLSPSLQILKAGPATIHRKGWRLKRRVWLELSHDMLCSYTANNENAHRRPLCTLLLPFVGEVFPPDPQRPRIVRIILRSTGKEVADGIEFSTEESAQEWRTELRAAIAMYRHRHREAFDGTVPDSSSGIKLSCPLVRIDKVEFGMTSFFQSIASIHVTLSDEETTSSEGTKADQIFNIGPVMRVPAWDHIADYVSAAKKTNQSLDNAPIIVDFGPLTFLEGAEDEKSMHHLETTGPKEERAVRAALALEAEPSIWYTRARIYGKVASYGYFVVSPHYISFWSKNLTGCDTKYRFVIKRVKRAKSHRFTISRLCGMTLELDEKNEITFAFGSSSLRDEVVRRVNEATKPINGLVSITQGEECESIKSDHGTASLSKPTASAILAPVSRSLAAAANVKIPGNIRLRLPKVINLPREVIGKMPPLHFVCLTIGSRGDIQPYIALALGLKKQGHSVTIVTHEEYKEWIEGHGIGHRHAGGDPAALMKLSVDHKMFSPEFFKQSLTKFRPWLDRLLIEAWDGCRDADVLLESPSAMAGVHIAEALGIPYFRTFTMPWTKTSEFPHPFLSPPVDAPRFNSASYILFNNVLWAATSKQINKWRKRKLKLPPTTMDHLAQLKIIYIYNFSSAVVPKPLDWGDTITISGYWFLDEPELSWTPPPDLLDFIQQARKDDKPLVYIGFGSITVPRPHRMASRLFSAVQKSGVRAIMTKGWSSRLSREKEPEPEVPPECYLLDKVPHDWLFSQIDATLHHGGAGTTGASLRAGLPTIIKPWFGDQYFWASRVQKLGAGIRLSSLRSSEVSDALVKVTSDPLIKQKAASVGEKIRAEDGVHTAIYTIPQSTAKRDRGIRKEANYQTRQLTRALTLTMTKARAQDGGTLEDYDVQKEIHKGGTSRLFLAQCHAGRLRCRKVVLKQVLNASSTNHTTAIIHQGLCHPNIISLYSIILKPSVHHVLEYCSEGSLKDIVQSRGPLTEGELRGVVRNIVDALLYLRKELVVHRNMRPSAVLLSDGMKAKLANFSFAKRLPTVTSEICEFMDFKSPYIAPETILGMPHSFPVEVWSLGCIILYCSSGNPPSNVQDVKKRVHITEIAEHPFLTPSSDRKSSGTFLALVDNQENGRTNRNRLYGDQIRRPTAFVARRSASDPIPIIPDADISLTSEESEMTPTVAQQPFAKPPKNVLRTDGHIADITNSESESRPGKKRLGAIARGKHSKSDKENDVHPTKHITDTHLVIGCTKPLPFNTSLLVPKVHKTTHGALTVLPSGSLLVDFRECQRKARQKGDEVIVIDKTGNKASGLPNAFCGLIIHRQVSVYYAPHLSTPCCLVEPKHTYTLDVLPQAYWKQYNDASKLVDQIKERTPKVVSYQSHSKSTLMANGPPGSVEVLSWLSSDSLTEANELSQVRNPTNSPHLRIRISRLKRLAEVARYINRRGSAEWTKKTFEFKFDDLEYSLKCWDSLDPLERTVMKQTIDFIKSCAAFENTNHETDTCSRTVNKGAQLERGKGSLVPLKPSLLPIDYGVQPRKVSQTLVDINMNSNEQRHPQTHQATSTTNLTPENPSPRLNPKPSSADIKFIPEIGWCFRQNPGSLKAGRYKILFLDGVTMNVDVDEEWVEYVSQSGDITCHGIRDAMGRRKIGDRFKAFEEFVSLYDDRK